MLQRRASHPAVPSLADSMATAMAMTDIGEPGKRTTMPRMLNHAAAAARAIAATYAITSAACAPWRATVTLALISLGFSNFAIFEVGTGAVTIHRVLRLPRSRLARKAPGPPLALRRT